MRTQTAWAWSQMASRKLKRKSEEFYRSSDTEGAPSEKKHVCTLTVIHVISVHACNYYALVVSKLQNPTTLQASEETPAFQKCDRKFFSRPCSELAKSLLGCVLVRVCSDGTECKGKIVETEAYLGGEDKAAHSYNGKKTERNTAMYMQPGTSYVYSIYGMYCCFNISSQGEGAAVLVRALEPLVGVASMQSRRKAAKKDKDLCSGPAKLCQAMEIDKSCDKVDLISCDKLWVEPNQSDSEHMDVIETGRIGVEYAGEEWATKPLRFYIKNNPCVSKK